MASNLSQALRRVGGLTVQRLVQGMNENNSGASGDLEKSISFKVKKARKGIDLDILMLDYWEYVDGGRPAGKRPPIDKIKEWLTYPNTKSKLDSSSSLSFTNIAEVTSLAYIIAKKIGEKGTEGTDFATNVFESPLIEKELPDIVLNAIYEDASNAIDELITTFE